MLSLELRNIIYQFVNSEITIEELENWYVPRLAFLLSDPNSDDADVVAAVELGLAELSNGLTDEDELRATLASVLKEQKTLFVQSNKSRSSIITGTSNQTSSATNLLFARRIESTN